LSAAVAVSNSRAAVLSAMRVKRAQLHRARFQTVHPGFQGIVPAAAPPGAARKRFEDLRGFLRR